MPFRFFCGRELFRPLFAGTIGVLAGGMLYFGVRRMGLESAWLMLPVLLVTVLVFLLLALRMGAVAREDLIALPAGEKLCTALQMCKLIK